MKKTKENINDKLKNAHNFLDNIDVKKQKINEIKKDNDLFDTFKDEIKKDDIIKNDFEPVIQKQKIISTSIDDDLKENDIHIESTKNTSDLLRAFESLSNPENMESNTILTNSQVIALSTINYMAQVYDIEFFKQFIKIFPRYRISGDDGRGRKELIEIANAIRRDKEEEHNRFMEILGRR
jgi:hypothetical protein